DGAVVGAEGSVRRVLHVGESFVASSVASVGLKQDVTHVQQATGTQDTAQLSDEVSLPTIARNAGQHSDEQGDVEGLVGVGDPRWVVHDVDGGRRHARLSPSNESRSDVDAHE